MPRFFLEISYKGTNYSGFQVQNNGITIQQVIEDAIKVFTKKNIQLTGSSRTDAGVHALQNFFHFDSTEIILATENVYNLNSILPNDVVVKNISPVQNNAHCRFDAQSREYKYFIYQKKNAFLQDTAWHYPYTINEELLHKAAKLVMQYNDFTSFSKKHTQVKNFICQIHKSVWMLENDCLVYNVQGNRFLRGMVKALVGTMLKVARQQITLQNFEQIIAAKDCTLADFNPPSKGLFLVAVNYPANIFLAS